MPLCSDAIINSDRVENDRHTSCIAQEALDEVTNLVEVGMAGDAVGVTVADGNERLVPVRLRFDGAGGAWMLRSPGIVPDRYSAAALLIKTTRLAKPA